MSWNILGGLFNACKTTSWTGGMSCDATVKCETTQTCDAKCDVSYGNCTGTTGGVVDKAINFIADCTKWFVDCAVSVTNYLVDCTVKTAKYLVDCTVDCIELVKGCETVDTVVNNAVTGAVDLVAGGVAGAVGVVANGVKGAGEVVAGTYGDDKACAPSDQPAQDNSSCFDAGEINWASIC